MRYKITPGAVSTGTLNHDHLLETLGCYLKQLATNEIINADQPPEPERKPWHLALAQEAIDCLTDLSTDGASVDHKDDTLTALYEAIAEYAPPYLYFAANEGDGACIGWWADMDSLEEAVRDNPDDVRRVNDLSEVPDGFVGTVMLVNDHGNVTLYRPKIAYEEVWSCV